MGGKNDNFPETYSYNIFEIYQIPDSLINNISSLGFWNKVIHVLLQISYLCHF